MKEICLLAMYIIALLLIFYAAVLASQQYHLTWLPPFVGGASAMITARFIAGRI